MRASSKFIVRRMLTCARTCERRTRVGKFETSRMRRKETNKGTTTRTTTIAHQLRMPIQQELQGTGFVHHSNVSNAAKIIESHNVTKSSQVKRNGYSQTPDKRNNKKRRNAAERVISREGVPNTNDGLLEDEDFSNGKQTRQTRKVITMRVQANHLVYRRRKRRICLMFVTMMRLLTYATMPSKLSWENELLSLSGCHKFTVMVLQNRNLIIFGSSTQVQMHICNRSP